MTTHPQRGRGARPGRAPTPEQVLDARTRAGMTQTEAAHLIYCTLSAWQRWEQGERTMHPALYEAFTHKADASPWPRPWTPPDATQAE
jgi:putative transcriptional regulator